MFVKFFVLCAFFCESLVAMNATDGMINYNNNISIVVLMRHAETKSNRVDSIESDQGLGAAICPTEQSIQHIYNFTNSDTKAKIVVREVYSSESRRSFQTAIMCCTKIFPIISQSINEYHLPLSLLKKSVKELMQEHAVRLMMADPYYKPNFDQIYLYENLLERSHQLLGVPMKYRDVHVATEERVSLAMNSKLSVMKQTIDLQVREHSGEISKAALSMVSAELIVTHAINLFGIQMLFGLKAEIIDNMGALVLVYDRTANKIFYVDKMNPSSYKTISIIQNRDYDRQCKCIDVGEFDVAYRASKQVPCGESAKQAVVNALELHHAKK